jgi:hypothetical protein
MVRMVFDSVLSVRYDISQVPPRYDTTFAEWVLYENSGSGWTPIFMSEYYRNSLTKEYRPMPLMGSERIITGHGISIAVRQVSNPGDSADETNGLIDGRLSFSDPSKPWLTGLQDVDDSPFNWILSGNRTGSGLNPQADNASGAYQINRLYDPNEFFEGILGGTWAPFGMTRNYNASDGRWGLRPTTSQVTIPDLANLSTLQDVEIVLTPDKSKWSRCVVVETQPNTALAASGTPCFLARWAPSKDQNGVNESGSTGMSWFPGYAYNVQTGERLNIFFGENSWYASENGNDMLFNPTGQQVTLSGNRLEILAGGHHYIYVSNTPYDACAQIASNLVIPAPFTGYLATNGSINGNKVITNVYGNLSWTTIPVLSSPQYSFKNPANMPCEARVSLRVKRQFVKGATPDANPAYIINMQNYAAETGQEAVAEKSLKDLVRVVPNPYYAFSQYENSQLQSTVKITNLPQRCKISIYTLGGNLVRTFDKQSAETFQAWDMRNSVGVPISSGLYIIHVDGFELGHKTVKFFAVMPEIDLNSF